MIARIQRRLAQDGLRLRQNRGPVASIDSQGVIVARYESLQAMAEALDVKLPTEPAPVDACLLPSPDGTFRVCWHGTLLKPMHPPLKSAAYALNKRGVARNTTLTFLSPSGAIRASGRLSDFLRLTAQDEALLLSTAKWASPT